MQHLVVPPGFEPRLFAAEPEIYKPLCMTWDHRGRLWIAESTDYPNTKRRDGQGRDRITICEDTNGDGRADSFKVFAEGLNIPTSLLFANGGADRAPGARHAVSQGHRRRRPGRRAARCSSPAGASATRTPGPATCAGGWTTGSGGSSATRRFAERSAARRSGSARASTASSPTARSSSSCAARATTRGASASARRGSSSARRPTAARASICRSPTAITRRSAAGRRASWRASRLRTGFIRSPTGSARSTITAGSPPAAGHALYTARTYPRHYWNQTAFVAEPTGHLVATFTLERKGSDVVDYYGWNLLASDDEWTAPISAEVGPDGNVWVIDWYNYIVQHNPTPHGFQTGRGNAYETPLRDKTHGRIYRIVYKDARPSRRPALDPDDVPGPRGRAPERQPVLADARPAAPGRARQDRRRARARRAGERSIGRRDRAEPGAIHALWTLHGLGALGRRNRRRRCCRDGRAQASLGGRAPQCGAGAAARCAVGRRDPCRPVCSTTRTPRCGWRRSLGLADQPPSDEVAAAAGRVAARRPGARRPLAGRRGHGRRGQERPAFLKALSAHRPARSAPGPRCSTIAGRVAEHWARGGPSDTAGESPGGPARRRARRERGDPARTGPRLAQGPAGHGRSRRRRTCSRRLTLELTPRRAAQLVRLVGLWGNQAFDRLGAEIAASLLAAARDEKLSRVAPHRCGPAAHRAARQRSTSRAEQLLGLDQPPALARAGRRPGRGRRRQQGARGRARRWSRSCPRCRPASVPAVLRIIAGPRRLEPGAGRRRSKRSGPALRAGPRPEAGPGVASRTARSPSAPNGSWRRAAGCPTPTARK